MPAGVLKGPKAEEIWARAKRIASEGEPGLEANNPDKFYAIVMTIYKAICKKHGCSPSEERMERLLGRLEISEEEAVKGLIERLEEATGDNVSVFVDQRRGEIDVKRSAPFLSNIIGLDKATVQKTVDNHFKQAEKAGKAMLKGQGKFTVKSANATSLQKGQGTQLLVNVEFKADDNVDMQSLIAYLTKKYANVSSLPDHLAQRVM